MGMLESPGSEGAGSLLEEFFEIFAAGKADGLREDQARKKLGADRLLLPGDLLRQLVGEAENEQAQGQRGLSRFLTTWRKELAKVGRPHGEGEGCATGVWWKVAVKPRLLGILRKRMGIELHLCL